MSRRTDEQEAARLTAQADRAAWLAARREGVGASEVAGILGLSPWASPLSVWASKVLPDDDLGESEAEAMLWGQLLEQPILSEACRRYGIAVERVPQQSYASIVRHPKWPAVRLQATPDAYLSAACERVGVVEVKTTSAYQAEAWVDGVPLHYQAQVQAQLACTGLTRAVVLALVGGQRLVRHDVERDESAIALIEAAVVEFWSHVERREQPPARPTAIDVRALERLHPDDSGLEIEAGAHLEVLVETREAFKAQQVTLDEHIDELTAGIKTLLGSATYARLSDGRRLAYRWQEKKEHVTPASRSRVLRVLKAKKETP